VYKKLGIIDYVGIKNTHIINYVYKKVRDNWLCLNYNYSHNWLYAYNIRDNRLSHFGTG